MESLVEYQGTKNKTLMDESAMIPLEYLMDCMIIWFGVLKQYSA